jgi:hypothetical protein
MESAVITYNNTPQKSTTKSNYWFKVPALPSRYETTLKTAEGTVLFSSLPYLTTPIVLNFYETSVHVAGLSKRNDFDLPPERKVNDIVSFSLNSRRRMIKLISTIQFFSYYKTIFVTLTYHNDFHFDARKTKRDLDNYLKSIKHFLPTIDYIWRLEEQERGAPHFHILFFVREKLSKDDENKLNDFLKEKWIAIKSCKCHYCRNYGVVVEPINSTRKLVSYVAKYSAKVDLKKPKSLIGRRWGHSQELLQAPTETLQLSRAAYRVFYQILREQLEAEDRDLRYWNSLSHHDNDYFLFVSSGNLLGLLKKYSYRFHVDFSEGINKVWLIGADSLLI